MDMKKTAQALGVAIMGALTFGGAAELAQAECYVQAPLKPVHRSFIRRDVIEPGVYEVTRKPGVYGWTHQKVVHAGGVIWHEEPSVYRTVHVRVRQPGQDRKSTRLNSSHFVPSRMPSSA